MRNMNIFGVIFLLVVLFVYEAFKRFGFAIVGIAAGIPLACGIGAAITGGSFATAFVMVIPWSLIGGAVATIIFGIIAMKNFRVC